jgi:hypothetical protein
MVAVTLDPAYWQVGATAILATNELTDRVPVVRVEDVIFAAFCALAVNEIVPLSLTTVLYVKMIVPDAPAARFSGLPVVDVNDWVTVPTLFGVGGLGLDVTERVVLDTFLTVIRTWKLVPPEIAEIGLPDKSVMRNEVIDSDFRVHNPGEPTVSVPACENGGPVVVVEK